MLDPPLAPPFDATMRLTFFAALALMVVACKETAATGDTSSATAGPPSVTPPSVTPSAAPLPKPEALDVVALKASFKCGKASGTGPCAVLDEWKDCQPLNPVTQSGDGRWMGKGSLVKDGAFIDEFTLVRSRSVPLAKAGAGALPALIAIDRIPDDRSGETSNAEKAVRAFERGDVALPTNTAIHYLKERTEWSEAPVMAAQANQLYVATGSGGYLCAISKQRVLVVRRSPSRSHAGDGVYAILWPVSW